MNLSRGMKVAAVAATAAALYGLSYAANKAKKSTKKLPTQPSVEGVFELGARLPQRVVGDVMPPIELSFQPRTMTLDGTIVDGDMTLENSTDVANLVTDISQERSNIAYEYALNLIANEDASTATSQERDALIKRVVAVIAPRVDWSKGFVFAFDSPEGRVWRGVQLIVELASQSYFNKQALGGTP